MCVFAGGIVSARLLTLNIEQNPGEKRGPLQIIVSKASPPSKKADDDVGKNRTYCPADGFGKVERTDFFLEVGKFNHKEN